MTLTRRLLCFCVLTTGLAAAEPGPFDAARTNDTAVLKRYLAGKGDPNRRDPNGHTLLILAAYNGARESVDVLLKNRADVNLQDGMGTALMAASFKGDIAIAQKLLAAGARVNERNGIGATALMFAALTARVETVRMLLKYRADAGALDQRGLSARGLAEQQGSDETAKVLRDASRAKPRETN